MALNSHLISSSDGFEQSSHHSLSLSRKTIQVKLLQLFPEFIPS